MIFYDIVISANLWQKRRDTIMKILISEVDNFFFLQRILKACNVTNFKAIRSIWKTLE